MKRLICLSSLEQYEKTVEEGYNLNDFFVICDNERFIPFLNQKGICHEDITEFCIREHWDEINTWGWRKAANFIRSTRSGDFFKSVDLPTVTYLWLTVVLILLLKNYYLARKIIAQYSISEVVVFCSTSQYLWPEFSGNSFLNHFLSIEASQKKITTKTIKINGFRGALLPHAVSPVRLKLKRIAKDLIHCFYGLFVRPPKQADIMVYGTLRHLGATSIELKEQGQKVVFYDDEFRFEHFLFCLKNQIFYLIPACFKFSKINESEKLTKQLRSELDHFLESPQFPDVFHDQYGLSEYIQSHLFGSSINLYLKKLSEQFYFFEQIFKEFEIKSLLLDEDFNAHAFIASYVKQKGGEVFCISHANMALESKLSEEDAVFAQSFTFVHAAHEKSTYIEKGWKADEVCITGMPRYDRLIDLLKADAVKKKASSKKRILYCAGLLWPYSPDALGFVGWDMFGFKRSQEASLRFLMEAAQDLDVIIVIKPHYAEDEAMWADFVSRANLKCEVQLVKASHDYFDLLLQSDAMALCLWSSTLIEAGIANIPVLYLDPNNEQRSQQVKKFSEAGLCEVFAESPNLRKALQSLITSDRDPGAPYEISPQCAYYIGERLACNATDRVVSHIINKLNEVSDVKI